MVVLTDKQRRDLHEALREYLRAHGLTQSLATLEAELQETVAFHPAETVLEKKWSINLRLQQKVLDLEAQVKRLEQEVAEAQDPEYFKKMKAEGLPCAPPKFVLEGHRESVTCVAVHPKVPICASGSEDATVRLWDYETGEFERLLKGHAGTVNAVDWDPAGDRLASASADLTVKLWDVASGHCTRTLQGHDHNVSDVRFLPGGAALLSASRDRTLRLWDTHSGYAKRVLAGHGEWVRAVAVTPDGTLAASGSDDQTVRVWDLASGKEVQVFVEPTHVVECVVFSNPKADALLTAHSGPPDRIAPPSPMANGVEAVTASPPAARPQFVVAGSRDKLVRVWDITSGALVLTLEGHADWVRSVAVPLAGKFLLSAGDDKTLRVWDLATGRGKRTYPEAHGHFITAVAFHPAGKPVLVSASVDKTLRVWSCK